MMPELRLRILSVRFLNHVKELPGCAVGGGVHHHLDAITVRLFDAFELSRTDRHRAAGARIIGVWLNH